MCLLNGSSFIVKYERTALFITSVIVCTTSKTSTGVSVAVWTCGHEWRGKWKPSVIPAENENLGMDSENAV